MKLIGFSLGIGQKKNKRFNYVPRHFKDNKQEVDYKIDGIIRKNRDKKTESMDKAWREARVESRNRDNTSFNSRLLIIFLVLLFIALYILDFDLSIFFKK